MRNLAICAALLVAIAMVSFNGSGDKQQSDSASSPAVVEQPAQPASGSLGRDEHGAKAQGLDGVSTSRDKGQVGHNIEGSTVKGLDGLSIDGK